MSAERQWIGCAVAAVALSISVDAAAQKDTPPFPKVGFTPGGPKFEPRQPPGLAMGYPGKGTPGHGGEMPNTSNAGGTSENGSKGSSHAQGSAGNSENARDRQRQLHDIPTCQ